MSPLHMQLKILLPSRIFSVIENVTRIIAEARQGSFGLLPQRLDCVAALAPGILTYSTEGAGDVYLAVDEGVLIKTGPEVVISVRHAIGGADLGQLRQAVEREFVMLNERQKTVRTVVAKLESGLIRRFAKFHHA
jgi:F-type H+-transporting ATPase subunit epsilon